MSLPATNEINTLDYAGITGPAVKIPAKTSIDLNTLDCAGLTGPFAGNPASGEIYEETAGGGVVAGGSTNEINLVLVGNTKTFTWDVCELNIREIAAEPCRVIDQRCENNLAFVPTVTLKQILKNKKIKPLNRCNS